MHASGDGPTAHSTGHLPGEIDMRNKLLLLCVKTQNLLSQEQGQDLIEYALVVALIALGATAGIGTLATDINTAFTNIGSSLSNAL
jgi:pilus assembly protein Flp/PilA